MYTKLKDCLISPNNIGHYIGEKKSKTFGFFMFLVLLMFIPYCISTLTSNNFDIDFADDIAQLFEEKTIHYEIENGALVANTSATEFVETEITLEEETFGLALVFAENVEDANVVSQLKNMINYVFIFNNDKIRVAIGINTSLIEDPEVQDATSIVYLDEELSDNFLMSFFDISYDSLEGVNINFEDTADKVLFEAKIEALIESVLGGVKNKLMPFILIVLFIVAIFELLFSCLFLAILLKIFYRLGKFKFGVMFQTAILCSLPYALINCVAILTGIDALSIIGDILVVAYSFKALNTYYSLQRQASNTPVEIEIMPGVYAQKQEPVNPNVTEDQTNETNETNETSREGDDDHEL